MTKVAKSGCRLEEPSASLLPTGVDPILRMPAVIQFSGLSAASIYDLMSKSQFPKSIPLGPRARGWLLSSLEEWKQERIKESMKEGV